jgi:Fur family peroxide stress response transcriptional regulator
MADPQPRLNTLVATLRKRGCRITPQRMAILRILAENDGHPSVEQIYDRLHGEFPMTSLATVYKTVALLKEEGQILELGFASGSSRYDGRKPYPHPHLVCIHCQRILDPELGLLDDLSQELSQHYGYRIVSQRLDFFGICPQCQAVELKEGGEPVPKTYP